MPTESQYLQLINELGEQYIKKNVLLSNFTTFKIGGEADLFYEAKTIEELKKAVNSARKFKVPFFILGGGSNVLFGDKGFRGLVIHVQNNLIEIKKENESTATLYVEAGVKIGELLNFMVAHELSGLEFMAGIPGTVGGAIRGNAGAWQQSIGDKIIKVVVLNEKGKVVEIPRQRCEFSYRQSRFKKTQEVILSSEIVLEKKPKKSIEENIKMFLEKRSTQPKEPSAGCIFINPKPLAAGMLIDESGFKGFRIGDAAVSEKHANFIVNLGNAKAKEVLAIIDQIKNKVYEKFNINLEEEIVKVGEF